MCATTSASVAGTVVELEAKGPQNIRFIQMLNSAAIGYLQIFNLPAASVILGTTVPVLSLGCPASAGQVIPLPEGGINIRGQGLSIACTTTRGGLTANAMDINMGWGN